MRRNQCTDHAVFRYFERVHGLTRREIESEILGDLAKSKFLKRFSGTVIRRDYRLVIRRGLVVTVLPGRRVKKERRARA